MIRLARVLLLAMFAACAASAQAAGAVLTVCSESSPDGFDVAQSESTVTRDAAGHTVYDQLVRHVPGTAELAPGLAERWELGADGLKLVLHLRRGVKFHATPWFTPTREMNADDVLFSMQRQADPKSPWLAMAKNGFGLWHSFGLSGDIASIAKLDEHTVLLTLRHPSAPLLEDLANALVGSVYSAEYGAKLLASGRLEDLNTRPVGTGPFVFTSYQKDATIRFSANRDYWGGAPKFERLVFAITPDPAVRAQRVKSGECLIGVNLKSTSLDTFADGGEVRVLAAPSQIVSYIALNTQHGFLADARLRRALALALDKATLLQSVYNGRAQLAASFLPPALWAHDAALAEHHDLQAARELVKASGYDGSEFVIFTRTSGSIDALRAAELMQADWARIGVKTRVQTMEWGEMLKRVSLGEHDITFFSWIGNADPDSFLTPNLSCSAIASGGNSSRWCDPAFDQVLAAARSSTDRERRKTLYAQAQRTIAEQVPVIPTVYPYVFNAVNRKVDGFLPSPLAELNLRGLSPR